MLQTMLPSLGQAVIFNGALLSIGESLSSRARTKSDGSTRGAGRRRILPTRAEAIRRLLDQALRKE